MKTYSPKPEDIERRWYVVDADGAVLGRLASEVAAILRGKHKPIFAPHIDTGDNVVVINASGVRLTGAKDEKKIAYRHSGYPGGLTETKYSRLMRERPSWMVEKAVKGMLPHGTLGRQMAKKLHVYDGPEHKQTSQRPVELKLGDLPKWDGLPEPKPRRSAAATLEEEETAPKSRRSPAKRASAKPPAKAAAKKSTAKKSTAKKSTAKKSTAKRTGAEKPAAAKSRSDKSEREDG
jgi:large subunit ribosomal protein L13